MSSSEKKEVVVDAFFSQIFASLSQTSKLSFLEELTKLTTLELTLPGTTSDFQALSKLKKLKELQLEGSSYLFAEQPFKLTRTALMQILSPPRLKKIDLSYFDIEAFEREMFSRCKKLDEVEIKWNRIGRIDQDAFIDLKSSLDSFKIVYNEVLSTSVGQFDGFKKMELLGLINAGIDALNASSFAQTLRLYQLHLANNSIADLPPGVFDGLSKLKLLDLSHNRIKHVKAGVFQNLLMLRTLKMDGNPVEIIEANAFTQLDKLDGLFLKECRLKSIDSEMFNGLAGLKQLDLSRNLIERIEVVTEDERRINVAKADLSNEEKDLIKRSNLFASFSGLFDLIFEGNKLEKLDLNCFSNLKELRRLDLSSNKINELSGLIEPELPRKLYSLKLNENQLTTIHKSALPSSLSYLELSKNKLNGLEDDFFEELTQLKELDLSENKLTWTVTEATFASCRNSLEKIDLSQNESIRATHTAFWQMPKLKFLRYDGGDHLPVLLKATKLTVEALRPTLTSSSDQQLNISVPPCFSDGSIRKLTRDPDWQNRTATPERDSFNLCWLPNWANLSKLNLSSNRIESLDDPELFSGLKSLYHINLGDNGLTRIHRDIFKPLSRLQNIFLEKNKLSQVDLGLFRHQERLRELSLRSNGISFINLTRPFRTCPHLAWLNLAENELDDRSTAETIDTKLSCKLEYLILSCNRLEKMDFVQDITSLAFLYLEDNRIESIMSNGENLLGRLRWLEVLNLSRNRIRSLTDEMFIHLRHKLKYLDLSGNPLDFKLDSILAELI